MILEKNIEALYYRYSYLEGAIPKFDNNIVVEDTRSGDKTMIYKNTYIHSKHNPAREANKLLRQIDKNNLYIFAGIGMAYLLEELVQREPDAIMVIYEPSLTLFSTLLREKDITNLINNQNLYFIINGQWQLIMEFLSGKRVKKVTYIPLLTRTKHDEVFFTPLEDYIKHYNNRVEINKNTLIKFGKLWVKNQCLNLPSMGYKGDISKVFNSFSGIPGIIISAGPSMELIIPHLKKIRESFVILCVDTAYKSLLEEGIEPDFVMSIDAQYWNARHLEGMESHHSILIADPSIQPAAIRPFKNRVYFTKSSFPLGQYFENYREPLTKIASGGSVSTTMWDFSQKLGLSEIYIIGQDLGYPGGVTHYKNSYFEKRMINICSKVNTIESQSFKYIYDGYPISIPSNNGKNILSDKRMKIYTEWFNEQASLGQSPGYNLSPNGCKIDGIPFINIEQIISYPKKRDEINKLLQKLTKKETTLYIPGLLEGAIKIKEILLKITEIGNKALYIATKINNEYKKNRPVEELLKQLNLQDQKIIREGHSTLLSFIIEPFADSITKSSELSPYEALLESLTLYKNLVFTGELHIKHLNNSIKNMKLLLKDDI